MISVVTRCQKNCMLSRKLASCRVVKWPTACMRGIWQRGHVGVYSRGAACSVIEQLISGSLLVVWALCCRSFWLLWFRRWLVVGFAAADLFRTSAAVIGRWALWNQWQQERQVLLGDPLAMRPTDASALETRTSLALQACMRCRICNAKLVTSAASGW
jgi:hypothetical protein